MRLHVPTGPPACSGRVACTRPSPRERKRLLAPLRFSINNRRVDRTQTITTTIDALAAHIVVVDDEPEIREMIQEYLLRQGFAVSAASGGAELRALMQERAVDLVILDINMPGEDGLSIARYLRERGNVGIVMLTANGHTVDRIVGLEVGADDYVAKPCDLRELLARVRSLLRRAGAPAAVAAQGTAREREGVSGRALPSTVGHEVRMGRCILNLESRRLFDLAGAEVPITAMEFDLLKAFADHPHKVLSRERLLDLAHNKEMTAFDRSIDTRIARLRQKIEIDVATPQVIKTIRGAGYVFVPGRPAQ
jgi:Response regulators consisting of a CheY-like receiver domain and a winged-helix DNA-binding domain